MANNLKSDNTNTNTNTATATATTEFKCPVPHCKSILVKDPSGIAKHICAKHPTVASRLRLGPGKKKAYYCDCCDNYSNQPHAVCHECDFKMCFPTKEERDEHLREHHMKWWTEYKCRDLQECKALETCRGCGFNHDSSVPKFFTQERMESLPSAMCPNDRPDLEQRCEDPSCNRNHFWGRVRYLIILRARKARSEQVALQSHPDVKDVSQQATSDASNENVSQQAIPDASNEDVSQQATPHSPDVKELSSIDSDSDSDPDPNAPWEGNSCWFKTRTQSCI